LPRGVFSEEFVTHFRKHETPTDSPKRSATVSFFLEIYEMLVILPRCFSNTSGMLLRLQIEAVGMFASIKGGNFHLASGRLMCAVTF